MLVDIYLLYDNKGVSVVHELTSPKNHPQVFPENERAGKTNKLSDQSEMLSKFYLMEFSTDYVTNCLMQHNLRMANNFFTVRCHFSQRGAFWHTAVSYSTIVLYSRGHIGVGMADDRISPASILPFDDMTELVR